MMRLRKKAEGSFLKVDEGKDMEMAGRVSS